MREVTTQAKLKRFMEAVGRSVGRPARIYFVGGATAVLQGWRESTLDVDLKIEADADAVFAALPKIKEDLQVNVELASPSDFIPELPGWRDRSPFIAREGVVDFFHYDFYAQALAKVERGHALDRKDVRDMVKTGLVEPAKALDLFRRIEQDLIRYPAISPERFRAAVESEFGERRGSP